LNRDSLKIHCHAKGDKSWQLNTETQLVSLVKWLCDGSLKKIQKTFQKRWSIRVFFWTPNRIISASWFSGKVSFFCWILWVFFHHLASFFYDHWVFHNLSSFFVNQVFLKNKPFQIGLSTVFRLVISRVAMCNILW